MDSKYIEGYDKRYLVSKSGKIYSNLTNKYLKDRIINGYSNVVLYLNSVHKRFFVHRLVAQAFIPNPENKPCVNHKDGNKLNNNVENLEWCTYKENVVHAFENNLRKYNPSILRNKNASLKVRKFSNNDLENIRDDFNNGLKKIEIAKKYNVVRQTIYRLLKQDYKH